MRNIENSYLKKGSPVSKITSLPLRFSFFIKGSTNADLFMKHYYIWKCIKNFTYKVTNCRSYNLPHVLHGLKIT